jgi:DNA polymerase III subunit beta
MKISSLQENLKQGLYFVGHIAGKNVNLPILNNILIKTTEGKIQLITTDLEIGIIATVRGKVEKEGEFTVDSKVVTEYISLLPNKKIDIEQKDLSLEIKCDNYKTIIKGQSADDYPLIPQIEKSNFYKAEVEDFRQALSQVIFSVSTSETRPELTGVLFNLANGELTMAATDSFRLAEKTIKIKTNGSQDLKAIVPAKTLQEVIRILSGFKKETVDSEKKEITFYITENQIMFCLENIELVSRLIEGQYPDYKQIIPVSAETKIILNKSELSRAVKAGSIFSKTGINDINLDFPEKKKKMVVTAASGQVGENVVELDADINGKDNGVVVNYRFLLDGLNNINSENIKIEIINNSTPCILRPEKDDSYLYVIMPIKQ